jgi:pimeloyl-ACP methyl ester carboxylesterase
MTRFTIRTGLTALVTALGLFWATLGLTEPRHLESTNVVLVHGAWADGSSWSKVIPFLEARGMRVVAVQLPLTSLQDDVATTRRAIARITSGYPGPVLLVGHSYGGVVIGEVGNDPSVTGLVYVAAFAPDRGESMLSLLATAQPPSPLGSHLVFDKFGFSTIDPTGVDEDFAQCLPATGRHVIAATQSPASGAALTATVGTPAWKTKPSWYIVAKGDRAIPPSLEQTMAARIGAQTFSLDTCHLAMLDVPVQVANVITAAAGDSERL